MSILIAGAGPAGARLSELLALNGVKVTLVERLQTPIKETFSSAAIPISTVDEYSIPKESISSYWKTWQIFDPEGTLHQWTGQKDQGVVLDFGKLRESLWSIAQRAGVELLLGWKVLAVNSLLNHAEIYLQDYQGNIQKRKAHLVVDATGYRRCLIGKPGLENRLIKDEFIKGSGIEFILQGNRATASQWGDKLTFFLGSNLIPHGYCWIFPMANNQLKVGACSLPPPFRKQIHNNYAVLKKVLSEYNLNDLSVIDRHGGSLGSTLRRSELPLRERVISVGDAASNANLLGGEGIRHALHSAEILAPLLTDANQRAKSSDSSYQKPLLRYQNLIRKKFGWRWNISNKLAKKTWWGLSNKEADARISNLIKGLSKQASADDISALLFYYRFERYGLRLLPYALGLR